MFPRKGLSVAVAFLALSVVLAGCNNAKSFDPGHQILEAPAETISVHQLAARLNLNVTKRTPFHALLTDAANSVSIFADPDGGVFLNGARLEAGGPIVRVNGTIFLHGSLARSIAPRLRRVEPAPKPETQQEPPLGLVVLDPGHGGRDPGAIGCNGMFEKDCVLFVAHRVCRRLAESKVKVIMTRSDDRFVTLEGRAEIANRAQADLFVSIHADSAPRRAANGHTLYVARGASGAAAMAARCIAGRLAEIGIYSRGVREANYRVLVQTTCPAALVEIGYLSNHDEARRLATGRHRLAVGDAIAKGIVDALRKQSKDPTGR